QTGPMTCAGSPPPNRAWAEAWQRSWDALEADLIGDREVRLAALIDVVLGVVGPEVSVIDLGCGTGTVTLRLLERSEAAHSYAVDIDPVLLTIAEATFADDNRVEVVRADLRVASWMDALPIAMVDAVLTATALHWLPADVVRRLY